MPRRENPGLPKIDKARVSAARRVIEQYQPEVLLINEALWCQPVDGYHVDYAKLLGYQHQTSALYDGVWGNAILSQFPIHSSQAFSIYNRGGLISVLDVQGRLIQVSTYHPHPSRYPQNKEQDYRAIVSLSNQDAPFLIGGDFNAISPDDAPDHSNLTQAFARFSKQPEVDSARFIDGGQSIFPELSKMGLRDALPKENRSHTMPTRLVSDDLSSAMRIDHIWVNKHVKVFGGRVIQQCETDIASDHYPVLVDIGID